MVIILDYRSPVVAREVSAREPPFPRTDFSGPSRRAVELSAARFDQVALDQARRLSKTYSGPKTQYASLLNVPPWVASMSGSRGTMRPAAETSCSMKKSGESSEAVDALSCASDLDALRPHLPSVIRAIFRRSDIIWMPGRCPSRPPHANRPVPPRTGRVPPFRRYRIRLLETTILPYSFPHFSEI
jgi:hypothetical protein